MILCLALLALLAWIDWRTHTIPNAVVLPGIVIGLAVGQAWIAALVMFALTSILYHHKFWGGGDVKLAVMVAAFLGVPALLAIAGVVMALFILKLFGHRGALAVAPLVFVSACGVCGILSALRG